MKNSIDINEVKNDLFNPDFYLREGLINELVKISQRVKYTGSGIKKNEKPFDKYFLEKIKYIVDKSMDITLDYTCAPIIGLSLAGEYGENARECYHKVCKFNKEYNIEKCDKEFSKYLKNDSEIISMKPFYLLFTYSLSEKLKTLINKKSKEKKHKAV